MKTSGKKSERAPTDDDRRRRRVTLKEVAAKIGLSPTTVSLVLNHSPVAASIPPDTHRRVFAAAEELGYRPDFLARSLRSRRSFSVGILVPDIGDAYTSGVLSGIEEVLLEEGYFYLIASHRSRQELLNEYMLLLKDRLVEGFILVATPLEAPPGLPAVAVAGHTSLDQVTNVLIDHDKAAIQALSHLAELGHERIAFFKGPPQSSDTKSRWQAIVAAADCLGLEVRPELTMQLGRETPEGTASALATYRESHAMAGELLRAGKPFTALFAFNDVSAIGAMRAFLDAGLRVPEQVSVVGFDDIHASAFQNPSLTTVRQPLVEMGAAASRILLDHLAGRSPATGSLTVSPELVVRASTGPATS